MNPYSVRKLPSDLLLQTAEQHKRLRKHQGYTQAELAERSGVSLGSLKRFEQTGQIAFHNLLRLAAILGRLPDFGSLFALDEQLLEAEKYFSDQTAAR